jgi:hypothetical protein
MVNGVGSTVFSQEEKNMAIGNAIAAKNIFFIVVVFFPYSFGFSVSPRFINGLWTPFFYFLLPWEVSPFLNRFSFFYACLVTIGSLESSRI